MSSFLCFLCHNTIYADTKEDTREKYRDVIGMSLWPDSHLCYICTHMLNKLWLFKSICLKRSLEYPVLFNEKGTVNLQRNDVEFHILCSEKCSYNTNNYFINHNSQHNQYHNDNELLDNYNDNDNQYVQLNDDKQFDAFLSDQIIDDGLVKDHKNNDHVNELQNVNEIEHYMDNHNAINHNDNELDDNNEPSPVDYENGEDLQSKTPDKPVEKREKKVKKQKRKGFKKITLSIEDQKAVLDAKRKEKKYIEAEFKCYNCALGFLFKDTYQTHMMRHEESNGEYRCEVCTLRFASPRVLRAHAPLHAPAPRERRVRGGRGGRGVRAGGRTAARRGEAIASPCHLCGRVFRDAICLQQHLKRFHISKTSSRVYACSVCGKNHSNQAAVRTHMIKHLKSKFPCDKCASTFSSPYTLNQHKKKHENTSQELHFCDTCKVGYTSRKSLLAHRRNALIHQQTVLECPICGRMCPTQRSLTSHITTVHSTTKDYACNICRASYTSRKSLVRHMTAHNRAPVQEIHVCHKCPNTFKTRSKLNRHLRKVCDKDKGEEELPYFQQDPII